MSRETVRSHANISSSPVKIEEVWEEEEEEEEEEDEEERERKIEKRR